MSKDRLYQLANPIFLDVVRGRSEIRRIDDIGLALLWQYLIEGGEAPEGTREADMLLDVTLECVRRFVESHRIEDSNAKPLRGAKEEGGMIYD